MQPAPDLLRSALRGQVRRTLGTAAARWRMAIAGTTVGVAALAMACGDGDGDGDVGMALAAAAEAPTLSSESTLGKPRLTLHRLEVRYRGTVIYSGGTRGHGATEEVRQAPARHGMLATERNRPVAQRTRYQP